MKELTTMQPNELKQIIEETYTGKGKLKHAAKHLNISERTLRRYANGEVKIPQNIADALIIKNAENNATIDHHTKHAIETACQFSREHKTTRKQLILGNAAYIISHGELIAIASIRDDGTLSTPTYQP